MVARFDFGIENLFSGSLFSVVARGVLAGYDCAGMICKEMGDIG